MKIMIVDDESLARDRLRVLLNSMDDYEVCAQAANGVEALDMAQQHNPDVILLDIRMPGMDGIEAARYLNEMEQPPAIIFTTAYDQHALEAFETQAAGYLLKPIRRNDLEEALQRASRLNKAQLNHLQDSDPNPSKRTHICARVRGNLELIPIEKIFYFHADQKYVTVRHEGGEVIIEESLKSLENELADHFLRIHRNALAAKDRMAGMTKTLNARFHLKFTNIDDSLEISRRHVAEVRKFLKNR